MKKYLLALLLLLLASFGLAGCGSNTARQASDGKLHIVTSFYPMYIDAVNIAGNVDGVEVTNLTPPQVGCLHDYQLSPQDMQTIEGADILIANGGGMESFLDKAKETNPKLTVIDASKDIPLLKDGSAGEENAHVWLSVTDSIQQVKNITSALCDRDPAHADQYRQNALAYVNKLETLRADMHKELDNLPHKDIVTFHEAFPYLAREFGLHIAAAIEREPGTEPTPKELEDTIATVKAMPRPALFAEPQYAPTAAETIARETGAKVHTLDPIVTGKATPEDAKDAYIDAMKRNVEALKEALQ